MGKITVRHFLNKKVTPTKKDDLKFYPLYLQIIYNQFSTEKRSDIGIFLTDSGFDYYLKFNKFLDSEIIITKKWNRIDDLNYEISNTRLSIEVIEKFKLSVTRATIFRFIKELSRPTNDLITEIVRNNIYSRITDKTIFKEIDGKPQNDITYEEYLLCFDGNIIDSMCKIETYTNLNISGSIKDADRNRLMAVQAICKISNQESFASFILSDFNKILKRNMMSDTVEKYELMKAEINKLIEETIDFVSVISG